jgi:hypothetical protein
MFLYTQLALLSYGVFYQDMTAIYIIAGWMIFVSTFFYYMCFGLVSGLTKSKINYELPVGDSLLVRVMHITTVITIFKYGEIEWVYAVIYTIPWIAVNILTDGLALLVRKEILVIVDKE